MFKVEDLQKERFIKVGSISKSYGNQGELFIKVFNEDLLDLFDDKENFDDKKKFDNDDDDDKLPPLFVIMDGIYTPFFIKEFTPKGKSGFIARFSTISDVLHSEQMVGKELFCLPKFLHNCQSGDFESSTDGDDLSFLIGYSVQNENLERVGTITDIIIYPANICIEIENNALIPFHTDLVISLNREEKTLAMKIAEGLL